MDGSGAYQVRFVPEDGRPPAVLARTLTAAGAQSRFAHHLAELRAAGERGRVILVHTERRGRFAGRPIREVALMRAAAPWESAGPLPPNEPDPAAAVVIPPMAHWPRPVAVATTRSRSPWWRFWGRGGGRNGRAARRVR